MAAQAGSKINILGQEVGSIGNIGTTVAIDSNSIRTIIIYLVGGGIVLITIWAFARFLSTK